MEVTTLKKFCENFYFANSEQFSKSEFVTKFREFGVSKTSAYRYYDKLANGETIFMNKKFGRPPIVLKNNEIKRIKSLIDNQIFPGYHSLGRSLGYDKKTIKKYLPKVGVNVFVRKKVPKISEKQKETQIERLPMLMTSIRGCTVIMDDETYFTLDGHDFFGGKFFSYTNDLDSVPDQIRYREKAKFGKTS